jgi:hypothetical protein
MFKLSPTFREALNGEPAEADRGLLLNWASSSTRTGCR